MHTQNGIPILIAVPNGDWATAVTYDPSRRDAVTDWGHCMEQFRRCYRSTPGPIAGCVRAIKRCPGGGMTAGEGCCPDRCIGDFEARVAAGDSENAAVEATVIKGVDCVAGFREMADPVSP